MLISAKYLSMIRAGLGLASLAYVGAAFPEPRNVAFFYGPAAPIEQLQPYEWVVVQAGNFDRLAELKRQGGEAFAYVSIGEIEERHLRDPAVKPEWLIGRNDGWQSRVVDLTSRDLQRYMLEKLMAPLWKSGYRAFFLDTLDSYQLAVKDEAGRAAQVDALADLIGQMHRRFPGVKLMFNRGFEVLPKVAPLCAGVAAESLFAGWDPSKSTYRPVPEADRAWLLTKLQDIKARYQLPIVVIDYLPLERADEAREVARKIRGLGFVPWISNPAFDKMGIGAEARAQDSEAPQPNQSNHVSRQSVVGLPIMEATHIHFGSPNQETTSWLDRSPSTTDRS
jgi:hypothetical protein